MWVRWLLLCSLLLLQGGQAAQRNEQRDPEGSTPSCQAGEATKGSSLLALPLHIISRQRAAHVANEAAKVGQHHTYDQSKADVLGLPVIGQQRSNKQTNADGSDDRFRADVLIRLKANRSDSHWFGFSGDEVSGKNAPLDDDGYDVVAAMEADGEMEKFVRRLIKAMNLRIIDLGGLHGVVPYYSGTHETQSFANLLRDLKRGLKKHGKYGPWLQRKELHGKKSKKFV